MASRKFYCPGTRICLQAGSEHYLDCNHSCHFGHKSFQKVPEQAAERLFVLCHSNFLTRNGRLLRVP